MSYKSALHLEPIRLSASFEGRVQGVGFRYTAQDLARNAGLTGFVRNESDGSVTVIAEGTESALKNFVQALQGSHLGRSIRDVRMNWSEANSEFARFDILYY